MKKPLIQIIEDEAKIAQLLQDYLHANQFDTLWLDSGANAVETVREKKPDLILLDLMLPVKDGIEICREVRQFSHVPIIMLTARIEEIDRILGLEIGADDYICKPFSPREVIARIKAMLRRLNVYVENTHQASGVSQPLGSDKKTAIVLDHEKMLVTVFGHVLELTAVEFRLLDTLAKTPGRVFSRSQLLDAVYEDHRIVTERTVDSHIKNLRKKLNQVSKKKIAIKAVYSVGYKLIQEE